VAGWASFICDVLKRPQDDAPIFTKTTEGLITLRTEQSPDAFPATVSAGAAFVVMVNVQATPLFFFHVLADSAHASLQKPHGIVVFQSYAMLLAESFAVGKLNTLWVGGIPSALTGKPIVAP